MECFAGRWHRLLSYVHMVSLAAKRPPLSGACKLLRKRKTFQDLARWDWPALKNMRMNCNPNKYNWFFLLSPENKSSHRRSAVKTKSAPPVNLKSDRAVQNKKYIVSRGDNFYRFSSFHRENICIPLISWKPCHDLLHAVAFIMHPSTTTICGGGLFLIFFSENKCQYFRELSGTKCTLLGTHNLHSSSMQRGHF